MKWPLGNSGATYLGDDQIEVLRSRNQTRISCIKFRFLLTGTGFLNFQSGSGKTGTGFSDFQSGSGPTGIKKKTGIPVAQPDF